MAKNSVVSLLPRFNSTRMVIEYLRKSYLPASHQGRRYSESGFDAARRVAQWKTKVRAAWSGVRIRRLDSPLTSIRFGECVRMQVAVMLNGMRADDVVVELNVGRQTERERLRESARYEFEWEGVKTEAGEDLFSLELAPELCGRLEYGIRIYPCHELLTHPFEMGLMVWL